MKKRLLVVFTASLTVLATAAFSFTPQDDSSHPIPQRIARRIVTRIERRLNVTSQQREQAQVILRKEQPTIATLAASEREEQQEFAQMQTYDDGRLRDIAQRYAATNAGILMERAKIRIELRAVLNDQQRNRIDAFRGRLGTRFDERLNELIDAI